MEGEGGLDDDGTLAEGGSMIGAIGRDSSVFPVGNPTTVGRGKVCTAALWACGAGHQTNEHHDIRSERTFQSDGR